MGCVASAAHAETLRRVLQARSLHAPPGATTALTVHGSVVPELLPHGVVNHGQATLCLHCRAPSRPRLPGRGQTHPHPEASAVAAWCASVAAPDLCLAWAPPLSLSQEHRIPEVFVALSVNGSVRRLSLDLRFVRLDQVAMRSALAFLGRAFPAMQSLHLLSNARGHTVRLAVVSLLAGAPRLRTLWVVCPSPDAVVAAVQGSLLRRLHLGLPTSADSDDVLRRAAGRIRGTVRVTIGSDVPW